MPSKKDEIRRLLCLRDVRVQLNGFIFKQNVHNFVMKMAAEEEVEPAKETTKIRLDCLRTCHTNHVNSVYSLVTVKPSQQE